MQMYRIKVQAEKVSEDFGGCDTLRHPLEAIGVFQRIWHTERLAAGRESFVALHLNSRNHPVGYDVVAQGSEDGATVKPRDVFRALLAAGGTGMIVAHNHPSGGTRPSPEDVALTRRLVQGAAILGVRLLDHLVFAPDPWGEWRSFQQERLLDGLGS